MKRVVLFAMTVTAGCALLLLVGASRGTCVPVEPEEPACVAVDPYQFGACAMVLGVAFDGEACVTVSGCGCGDQCDAIFPDLASCREACGLPGEGLPAGAVCESDAECAEGLLCCYPCGIAGCPNRCTVPCAADEPWCAGGCPLYP